MGKTDNGQKKDHMLRKFLQSLAASTAFWYGPVLRLYTQLGIAATLNVASLTCLLSTEKTNGYDRVETLESN